MADKNRRASDHELGAGGSVWVVLARRLSAVGVGGRLPSWQCRKGKGDRAQDGQRWRQNIFRNKFRPLEFIGLQGSEFMTFAERDID